MKGFGDIRWRVQKALDLSGVEHGWSRRVRAAAVQDKNTIERPGQNRSRWMEVVAGSVYRAQSRTWPQTIRAGKLDEKRTSA